MRSISATWVAAATGAAVRRLGEHDEGVQVGVAWMLSGKTSQARLGVLDVAADQPGHDLVDEESIPAVDEEIELSPVGLPVRGRSRGRRRGRCVLARETESSQHVVARSR